MSTPATPSLEVKPEDKPAAAIPTDAEIDAQRQNLHGMMFPGAPVPPKPKKKGEKTPPEENKQGDKGRKAEDEKVEEKPLVVQEQKPEDKKEDKKPEEKVEKVEKPKPTSKPAMSSPAKPAVMSDADVDRVAEKVVEKMPAQEKQQPAPQVDLNLSEDDQERLEALEHIERNNPSRKGLVAATKAFWAKEEAYRDRWLEKHPGETFNADDDEHADFYEKNDPKVDAREIRKATKELDREKIKKEIMGELERKGAPEVEQLRAEQKTKEINQALPSILHDVTTSFIGQVGDEFGALLDVGGRKAITDKTINALREADPDAFEILDEAAGTQRVLSEELVKLKTLGSGYKLNLDLVVPHPSTGEDIYPHRDLINFANRLEGQIASLDPEERMKGTREFTTQADMGKRIQAIIAGKGTKDEKQSKIAGLQQQYWTLDPDSIHVALVAENAAKTKSRIDSERARVERLVETRMAKKNGETPQNGVKKGEPKEQEAPARKNSPSVSASSDRQTTLPSNSPGKGIAREELRNAMWPS